MEWFEQWFNSEEYLKVYRHRDEKEANDLVSLILKNIELSQVKNVLDIAAGSGRHALLFAKKGFNVTAVDLSANLLSVARKKALKDNLNIEFVHSDIRHFNSQQNYDLILNLFTSFGYFENDEDNYSILIKAYGLLRKNGYFIFDYFNKNYIEKNLVNNTMDELDGKIIKQKRFIKGERVLKEITIDNNGKINKYIESVRMFSYDEITTTLKKIGFHIVKIFGEIDGNSFELKSSPRMIIIASK